MKEKKGLIFAAAARGAEAMAPPWKCPFYGAGNCMDVGIFG